MDENKKINSVLKWFNLTQKVDERGCLTYLEELDFVPFKIYSVLIVDSGGVKASLDNLCEDTRIALIGLRGSLKVGDETISFDTKGIKMSHLNLVTVFSLDFESNFYGVLLFSEPIEGINEFNESVSEKILKPFPTLISTHLPRLFFISDVTKGAKRGAHAHKTCEQILVMLKGSCLLKTEKKGDVESYYLKSSSLHIDSMTWIELVDFSEDAILMVLSNERFYEGDYIRDYSVFKELE